MAAPRAPIAEASGWSSSPESVLGNCLLAHHGYPLAWNTARLIPRFHLQWRKKDDHLRTVDTCYPLISDVVDLLDLDAEVLAGLQEGTSASQRQGRRRI